MPPERRLARFRTGIETWFDSQMARLSALYRAQVRFVMLRIGILVAVAGFGLGVRTDSLGLVSDLQRDESLRRGLSDLAVKVSDKDLATIAQKGCPPTTTEAGAGDEAPPTTSTPEYVCVAKGLATYQDINLIFDDRGVAPVPPTGRPALCGTTSGRALATCSRVGGHSSASRSPQLRCRSGRRSGGMCYDGSLAFAKTGRLQRRLRLPIDAWHAVVVARPAVDVTGRLDQHFVGEFAC